MLAAQPGRSVHDQNNRINQRKRTKLTHFSDWRHLNNTTVKKRGMVLIHCPPVSQSPPAGVDVFLLMLYPVCCSDAFWFTSSEVIMTLRNPWSGLSCYHCFCCGLTVNLRICPGLCLQSSSPCEQRGNSCCWR